MDHGHNHRCTSTWEGQGLLRVSATEATMKETAITDMSATSMIGGP
jgi:hypothetical protein